MLAVSKLCFAVMDPTEVARWDQIVDMDIPQRGTLLCLVLAEQSLELTQARDLGAVKAEIRALFGRGRPGRGSRAWGPRHGLGIYASPPRSRHR